jgi:spore germination protein
MRIRTLAVAAAMLLSATSSFAYRVSVWVPPWISGALTTIQTNGGAIDESNPVWYSWNADTSIAKNWNAENSTWRAAMTGSSLVPTIQNVVDKSFTASGAVTMLSTVESREQHAAAITSLVIQNAYDGIDIDYERVPTTSRANFTAFITTLATKLHAAGKTLSVTVYPKTSDSQNWNGPGSQDWAALGRVADTVKIMAYDYHWSTSAAGTITPLDWLDAVTTYAKTAIPHSKIFIALPWYGYNWVGSTGTGVSYATAMQTAQNNGATITRDAHGEATYSYADRTVFFQDAYSYSKKLDLLKAKHSTIGGVAHWAAGQEDPAIWNVIRGGSVSTPPTTTTPGTGTSPATPVVADFAISGPSVLNVRAGSSSNASYDLVAINGFSGTASVTAARVTPSTLGLSISTSATTTRDADLRVSAPSSLAPGVYQIVVRFVSGSITREQLVNVVVEAAKTRTRASSLKSS